MTPRLPALLSLFCVATTAALAMSASGQGAPPPKLLLQTAGPVAAFDFSSDGTVLATAGADKIIRLWNPNTGELLREQTGPAAASTALAFSPEGQLVAAGWRGGPFAGPELTWFDAPNWEKPTITRAPYEPEKNLTTAYWLRFTADGKRLLVRHPDGFMVWDAVARTLKVRSVESATQSIALSPDGKKVAVWADTLRIRDALTGELLVNLTHGEVPPLSPGNRLRKTDDGALAWSPDSTKLATILADGSAAIRNAATGAIELPLERRKAYVRELTWSPDGKLIAGVCSEMIADYAAFPIASDLQEAVLWDPSTGRVTRRLAVNRALGPLRFVGPDRLVVGKPHEETLLMSSTSGVLARMPDGYVQSDSAGSRLAINSRQGGILVRDAQSGKPQAALPSQPGPIRRLALGEDQTVVSISEPGIARSWSLRFGRAAPRAVGPAIYDWRDGFSLAPNGASAVTRFHEHLVHWDTRSGAVRGKIALERGEGGYQKLAMLPGGILAQGYQHDGKIGETMAVVKLRRLSDGVTLKERRWPQRHIRHLSASPEGGPVALNLSGAGQDNPVHLLLDPNTFETKVQLPESDVFGDNVAWAGDGRSFAVVIDAHTDSKERIRVWNRDAEKPDVWRSTLISNDRPADLAVPNADGSRIAIGWSDGSLGLWRRSTGGIEPLPEVHPGGVAALLWGAGGQRLFSAGVDGRLKTWEIASRKLLVTSLDLGPFAWITWTPDEFYVAKPDTAKSIRWKVGGELRPAVAFEAERSKPFRVIDALK